jgi:hypothetical protein
LFEEVKARGFVVRTMPSAAILPSGENPVHRPSRCVRIGEPVEDRPQSMLEHDSLERVFEERVTILRDKLVEEGDDPFVPFARLGHSSGASSA